LMSTKAWAGHDADAVALMSMLRAHGRCTGRVGVMGFCFGGHLALRAALNADVPACAAFYPTGLCADDDEPDTLRRVDSIRGECAFFVGTEDPLLPAEERRRILDRLTATDVNYRWHEARAGHGYMRDGGADYDPELARHGYAEVVSLFRRNLFA